MRRHSLAAAIAAMLVLTSCGNDKSSADVSIAPAPTPSASTSTSTTPPATSTTTPPTTTTTTAATSTLAPTTVAATTVPAALPNPEAPPADPRGAEALVDVGTIEIPKIGVSKSMFEGITLTTLDNGPGHWPGTAMPGQVGNVVIAGHRVSHDKPFRHLEQLVAGDDVIMTTADGRFDYKVTGTEIVTPDALWIADQTPDYTATLFACNPPGSTKQRIVVHLALDPTG
jgi:sortase A